jgi:hypothetical protein
MMRFGEALVKSRQVFKGVKHLKRADAFFGHDLDGKEYARLDLPAARVGEIQSVFLTGRGNLCPIDTLRNLARMVPAGAEDPLGLERRNQTVSKVQSSGSH